MGIAVPVRNGGPWLGEMLRTVCQQTYQAWQLVVVDDGSTDESLGVALRYRDADPRIRVISSAHPASGPSLARADGRKSLGDEPVYLYFPDADDLLEAELLSRLVARLEREAGAVAAFCRYTRIDEFGNPIDEPPPSRIAMTRHWTRRLPDDESRTPFESIYGWASPAMEPVTMLRASVYDAVGGWEGWPSQGGESIDLLCRMLRYGPVVFEPQPLYRYRRHGGQYSTDADRLSAAAASIRSHWRDRSRSDTTMRPVVERAEFFVDHRLIPRLGFEAAIRHLRQGRVWTAARFFGGALRRYRWRAFPDHWS